MVKISISLDGEIARWYVCADYTMSRIAGEIVHFGHMPATQLGDQARVGAILEIIEDTLKDGLPEVYSTVVSNNNIRLRMVAARDIELEGVSNKLDDAFRRANVTDGDCRTK
jgi:hypothetical protein